MMKNIFKKTPSLMMAVAFSGLLFAAPVFDSAALSVDKYAGNANQETGASYRSVNDNGAANINGNGNLQTDKSYIEYAGGCRGTGFFLNMALTVFIALISWTVSPIGVLFFGAAGTLLTKSSSELKRKVARGVQGIAFLTWASLMFLLLVFYVDSVSYQIFNLGGDVLNLAIISGFAFFIIMILMTFFEKEARCNKNNGGDKNDKGDIEDNIKENKTKPKRNRKCDGSIKFAGIEFGEIKGKIKEGIKEIINDKIDKL